MKSLQLFFSYYIFCFLTRIISCVEFTFDLPDNAEDCFYEEITKNTTAFLEFQVSAGAHLDVDVTLIDPKGKVIYQQERQTFDSHQFVAEITGVYRACFSNKFSSFSHKLIYVDFQVGEEQPLPGIDEHVTVLTQLETSSQNIHKSLNQILDAQTHHRLREAQGRKRAEDLNERVLVWAFVETLAILIIAITQILVLKNFFSDRKPINPSQYRKLISNYQVN